MRRRRVLVFVAGAAALLGNRVRAGSSDHDDSDARHDPGLHPCCGRPREPEPDHEPAPVPFADAEPGPIQIVNSSEITSPNISSTRSPVLSEERLSSRRHCS